MAEDTKPVEPPTPAAAPAPAEPAADRGDFFEALDEAAKTGEDVKEPEKAAEPDKEEPKAEPAKEPKENVLPQSRVKELVEKERFKTDAAIARAKELEGRLTVQQYSEDLQGAQAYLKTLIKERNQNLSDGTLDKAGEIDDQIIELQAAITDRKSEERAMQAKEMAKEEMRYDNVLTTLEANYPVLNPEAEEYSQDDVDEVRALMRGYQADLGLAPSAALARAAKKLCGPLGTSKLERPVEDKSKEIAVNRKKEAVERNLDAAKKTPASSKDLGLDHDKRGGGLDAKTVMSMNYKEFSELGDDVKSKLRGDTL